MPTISMLIRKVKQEKQLKEKYLNKTVYFTKGTISVVYHIHKVKNGWLYCYHGNEEVKFRPCDVNLFKKEVQ